MKLKKMAILMTVLLVMLSVLPVSMAKDPNGADTLVEDPDSPVNFTWVLISAFLVFFMQTGFAILGAGAIRVKNVVSYMTQSYMDFSIGALAFFLVGFAFMFGGSMHAPGLSEGNAFIGLSGFALMGEAYDVTTAMFFLFHVMFAAAAATIVAGAVAGRMKFQAYLIYTAVITTFIYSIHGHWIWGGGWLASLPFGVGAIDFAGSGAVHAVGGSIALAGAYMVGPRKGKFRKDGTPVPIPGHNVSYVVIGAFILFMGWFGFNPGST
ncbi:MAG: ammonium transporter, partial [Halobacteriota archaeon]|nr:ammonium transporter [Halobacteriota archaeon]